MISTFSNYRFYANDMASSLARIEADASVKREAQYYADNIGKVETVDDFLSDYRLSSYALKAYGLEAQIGSTAFVRQILESDLSDATSFANRLTDPRYRDFASAFDFASASAPTSLQSQAQTDRLVEAYSEHVVRAGSLAAQKASAFETMIGTATSVDQLLNDPASFEMIARIAGFDPKITSKEYVRAVILGAPSQGAGGIDFLSRAFSFDSAGKAPAGEAQSAANTADFIGRYLTAVGQGNSSQAAAFEARHFERQMASITTVEQLVDDPTLYRVIGISFGLDPAADTPAFLLKVLTQSPQDADSEVSKLLNGTEAQKARGEKLLALAEAFDFSAEGTAEPGKAIGATAASALTEKFYAAYPSSSTAGDIALKTNSFRVQLTRMNSINDLLGRDPVYGKAAFDYILKAFDIDPTFESNTKIRKVLQSDPSDPNSFVRSLNDERYEKLAAAFNFDANGQVRSERLVQSVRVQQSTAALYSASFGTDQSDSVKASVRAATETYLEQVGGIRSLEDFLASGDVLAYALKAHGLDQEKLTPAEIRKLVTSDLADPDSYANAFGDARYRDFAGSFNFQPDGRIGLAGESVQRPADFLTAQNLYLLQLMESQAGETSEGTRLALYFLRKSPEIENAFSILADKALYEVARTALGLPASMSQLDIDRQAAILEQRLDFDDFKDPARLDRFISRFSALYDIENGTGSASAPVLQLFGNSGSSGVLGLF
ncbi:DUF1217 domain-containing protein [Aureimonas populi]|uniref:DUF1217 domain-containing protein n=1 Tax=Aureimonas populi TaxID=1701758 RepID=A0ABW5CHZ4_9HYPH|nr:DUF1217 domain-containing protein [Aureimonas populi]